MGMHRTPHQLLAEALEKVKQLKIKAAQHSVANDPRMLKITKEESRIKKELSKALKWLDPEKGLQNRISKLQAQIHEARHNLDNAKEIQQGMTLELEGLQGEKEALALELAEDLELETNG